MVDPELLKLPRTRKEAQELGIKHFFTGRPCKRGHLAARYTSMPVCMACGNEASLARKHGSLEAAASNQVERLTRIAEAVCSVEGCDQRPRRGGMCPMHYQRVLRARQEPTPPPAAKAEPACCTVDGCGRPQKFAGLCIMHYERKRRLGDAGEAKPRRAAKGQPTLMHCGATGQCPAAKKLNAHLDYARNPDRYKAAARASEERRVDELRESRAARYRANPEPVKAKAAQWKRDNPERRRETNRRNTQEYRGALRRATPPWVNQRALSAIYEACPRGMSVDHIIPLRGKTVCGLHVPWNLKYLPGPENGAKANRFDEAQLAAILAAYGKL